MRVGVITLMGRFNYGNRLQNYASVRALEKAGCAVDVLDQPRGFDLAASAKKWARSLLGRKSIPLEERMAPARLAAFDEFNARMRIVDSNAAKSQLKEYDRVVVGSDQVWNPRYIKGNEDWFLLQGVEADRRVALAASFGVDSVPTKEASRYRKALRSFQYLSVREEAGADIVEQMIGRRPAVICDPTLAMTRAEWTSVASGALNPSEPYVFSYLLGSTSPWQQNLLWGIARDLSAREVNLSQGVDESGLPAGPAEFVGLIAGAKHVVTDSFHAAVFAALFERPLTIVRREGGAISMFSRLETLADTLSLRNKIVEEGSLPSYDAAADYTGLDDRLKAARVGFEAFIDESLESARPPR